MMTISPNPLPPGYVFKNSPEKVRAADRIDGKGNSYLNSQKHDDPLYFGGVWVGKMLEELGIPQGSAVEQSTYESIYYGIDPRSPDKKPLIPGTASIAEQERTRERIEGLEKRAVKCADTVAKITLDHFKKGGSRDTLAGVDKYLESTKKLEAINKQIESLKRSPGNRAKVTSLSFAADKSISMAWAKFKQAGETGDKEAARLASEIEKAYVDSIREVFTNIIEPQLIFVRDREGGNKNYNYENVKGLGAAIFLHPDARPTIDEVEDPARPGKTQSVVRMPDMQLHGHCELMAIGLDYDDHWRATVTTMLGSQAKACGAAFRAELAARLQALGLDICHAEVENVEGFGLTGIDRKDIAAFSSRRAGIAKLLDKGVSSQKAVLAERVNKLDSEVFDGNAMLKDWGERFEGLGITKEKILGQTNEKLAREKALDELNTAYTLGALEFSPGSEAWGRKLESLTQSHLEKLKPGVPTVEEAIEELMAMDTAIDMTAISRLSYEAAQFCYADLKPGQSPIQWAEDFRAKILAHPELKTTYGLDRYGRPTFASRRLLEIERNLYYNDIPKLLAHRQDSLDLDAVNSAIEEYQRTESEMRGVRFELKEFQKDMVRALAMSKSSIHIALAPAGCGKTTAALGAVIALEKAGFEVLCVAPSLNAAQGLASDLRKKRIEGISPQSLIQRVDSGKLELTNKHVIFVDEASMMDGDTAAKLVRAALNAKGGPARIILQGDIEQLPAVGRGNFLRALAESQSFQGSQELGERCMTKVAHSMAHWDRITRQSTALGKQATTFYAMGHTAKALEIYERMGALKLKSTLEQSVDHLVMDAYLPMAEAADHYKLTLAARQPKLASFATRALEISRELRVHGQRPPSVDEIVKAAKSHERALAEQWRDDLAAIEKARSALHKRMSQTMMLATKRKDVTMLNEKAREILKTIGALGGPDGSQVYKVPRNDGSIEIAEGDRLMFTEKVNGEKALFDVAGDMASKSTVGTVLSICKNPKGGFDLRLRLDGKDQTEVLINTNNFDSFNHAYAMTAHASQGATKDYVYELVSSFAATQTDYVSKSRYRLGHWLYGVESEYDSYKAHAMKAIEKLDTIDRKFAAEHFGLSEETAKMLDQSLVEYRAEEQAIEQKLMESRLRAVGQGTLVEHGRAKFGFRDDQKDSYFVKIEVGGRIITVWGAGLEKALEERGIQVGDHFGLEAKEGRVTDSNSITWSIYDKKQLETAGVLMDEEGRTRLAVRELEKGLDKTLESSNQFGLMMAKALISEKEKLALAQSHVQQNQVLGTQRMAEMGNLAELGLNVELPKDLNQRLERAAKALPFSTKLDQKQILGIMSMGETPIITRTQRLPQLKTPRKWIGHDGVLAYCQTDWNTIEAWSMEGLPKVTKSEIEAAGSIEVMEKNQAQALSHASRSLEAVQEAFGQVKGQLDIKIFVHPKHGLSLGVAGISSSGRNIDDPFIREIFNGKENADWGEEFNKRKGGIAGLKSHKGFDPANNAWTFPLNCDASGTPQPEQPRIAELIAFAKSQGLSHDPHSKWDRQRKAAWDRIEAKLVSSWGLLYAMESNGVLGANERIHSHSLAKQTIRSEDHIVRWNDTIVDGDTTQHWQFCSSKPQNTTSQTAEDVRILEGLVLHSDDTHVYLRRDQYILAVEREHLGLQSEENVTGKRMWVEFSNAGPKLHGLLDAHLMAEAKSSESMDQIENPKQNSTLALLMTQHRLAATTPVEERAMFQVWAREEASNLDQLKQARLKESDFWVDGKRVNPQDVRLLELYNSKETTIKGTILGVGPNGVLIETLNAKGGKGPMVLMSREEAKSAFPGRCNVNQKITMITRAKTFGDRTQVDITETAQAMESRRQEVAVNTDRRQRRQEPGLSR